VSLKKIREGKRESVRANVLSLAWVISLFTFWIRKGKEK
jgi:hypothetical protein